MLECRQVADDVLVEVRRQCVGLPVFKVGFNFDVDEPVHKRRRHLEGRALVRVAVASCHDDHVARSNIFTEGAVENQLIGAGLDRRSSVRKLVEKDDCTVISEIVFVSAIDFVLQDRASALAGVAAGKHCRNRPVNENRTVVLLDRDRNTAKVGRFHLRQTHVDELEVDRLADLANDGRLGNARRTPEEQTAAILAHCGIVHVGFNHVLDGDGSIRRLQLHRVHLCSGGITLLRHCNDISFDCLTSK
ncbi:hypothetical protein D3C71_1349660 [compost metagenome]